jgi:hypothetical protein
MTSGDPVIARDRVIWAGVETSSLELSMITSSGIGEQSWCLRDGRAPITGSPDHPITRSSPWLVKAWRTIVEVLREIFDESAYERFLARTHNVRSVESYRQFLRDGEASRARRPRCC